MSTRSTLRYDVARPLHEGGFDPDVPEAGFYRMRLRQGAMFSAVCIWLGAPVDPATGEEVPERGERWQASMNNEPVPIDHVWPRCAKHPITKAEHDYMLSRQAWGRDVDPDGPDANPQRPVDLMRAPIPI